MRVFPEERSRGPQTFEFMGSNVSTEKPKNVAIRQIARQLAENRAAGGRTAIVAGPAVVHTGSGEFLEQIIRMGYVDVLLAGNALATHDIEQALFGTSLGVYLDRGILAEVGPRPSPPRDQPHSPPGRDPACGRKGRAPLGGDV